ncbi:MAG: virulence RhuM family protein [Paludibacteraceae bacterium]|nr:virulence RhuM family protein [Paludibacteraceae bacterium]
MATFIGIDTKYLKKVIRRNFNFFSDENLVFELTSDENSKLQNEFCGDKFVSSKTDGRGGSRYLPFAFTKAGISMLEKVLKRDIHIEFEEEIVEAEVLPKSWNEGTVVLYQPNDDIKIDVRVENETVWLTQDQMALLFGTKRQAISKHISNIYEVGELDKSQTCSILEQVQTEGGKYVTRKISIYNLDMIISVGYRVKSLIITQELIIVKKRTTLA